MSKSEADFKPNAADFVKQIRQITGRQSANNSETNTTYLCVTPIYPRHIRHKACSEEADRLLISHKPFTDYLSPAESEAVEDPMVSGQYVPIDMSDIVFDRKWSSDHTHLVMTNAAQTDLIMPELQVVRNQEVCEEATDPYWSTDRNSILFNSTPITPVDSNQTSPSEIRLPNFTDQSTTDAYGLPNFTDQSMLDAFRPIPLLSEVVRSPYTDPEHDNQADAFRSPSLLLPKEWSPHCGREHNDGVSSDDQKASEIEMPQKSSTGVLEGKNKNASLCAKAQKTPGSEGQAES